jgi:hypothetical protein
METKKMGFKKCLDTLAIMAMAAILNLFNIPKAVTQYGGYSYNVS